MSKHTPEPWELLDAEDDKEYLRIRGAVLGGRYKIANVLWPNYSESAREREAAETLANAARIIDCVNACAGMEDPAAEIAELKALSVTNILLDVTPGDGSGLEVYAKSTADVSELLYKMDEEIADLKRQRDELLAVLGDAMPLIKQARLDWCDQNSESYDEDVVTPYDAILYRPILSLLENKGSES